MPRRTLPQNFPFVHPGEGWTAQLLKASLMRRLAQAQNYLWANLRRVYAGHGYDGFSNYLGNTPNSNTVQVGLDPLPDGSLGRPVCTFYVPRNWCAGTLLRNKFRYTFTAGVGSPTARVVFVLYRLDDTYAGIHAYEDCTAGTKDGVVSFRVPQDQDYQCRVFIQLVSAGDDAQFTNLIKLTYLSSRYDTDATDIHGLTPSQITWANRYDLPTTTFPPAASAFFDRIIRNTLWHYTHRNPELCQAYFGVPWHNTSTFTEVGRYAVNIAAGVSTIEGRLYVRTMNGGAGSEVRVLLNGTVQQTWTALALGDTELTSTITLPNANGAEYTITIEARNSTTTNWGTIVWGVSYWESVTTLPGATVAAPTDYAPLDEDYLEGDDNIVALYAGGSSTFPAGFVRLQQNDRWLMKNRPRHLIGDWRHRTLKRLATYTSYGTTFDPRVDWSRGDNWSLQLDAYKNMTIRGDSGSYDDTDSLGNYSTGQGGNTGYNETPYTYPSDMYFTQHGRRLGRYPIAIPTGITPLVTNGFSQWRLMVRARRLRPYLLSTDVNGNGPAVEEPAYLGKGYVDPIYDGTSKGLVPIQDNNTPGRDTTQRWLLSKRADHLQSSGVKYVQLRGRLPSQPVGAPPVPRPEGMCFEIEVTSVFLVDEPLTASYLATL